MFELLRDFNENGVDLKKGHYSKEELIKLYEDEGRFNFCLTCTSLKEVLIELKEDKKSFIEKIVDVIANPSVEDTMLETSEFETIYIAKEDIKKGKKVIFKKEAKITFADLEKAFGDKVNEIFEQDLLMETKIANVSV